MQDIDQQTRRDVAAVYRSLGDLGMTVGRAGNVSHRTAVGMIITPSGVPPEETTPDTLVALRLDGRTLSPGVASSEWHMHARIYEAARNATCIVHTHSDACTALAALGEDLPAFHYMIAAFGGGDVRCAPYATFGTPELAEAAIAALEGRTACLLANHGMIVHAASSQAALSGAILLETLARQYLLARAAGTPRLLTAEEMLQAQARFVSYDAGRG